MRKLETATLTAVNKEVLLPGYDRDALLPGIVHLGIGAFHRAHQAVYTDEAIVAEGGNWGIIGVSLRSDAVARQLRPQQCLYSVLERDNHQSSQRVVGCVLEVLVAPGNPGAVAAAIAGNSVHVVTLTITEKGYLLAADGRSLNRDDAQLTADLAAPLAPQSALGLLALGLRERWLGGGAPLTVISCDNLAANGERLRGVLCEYLGDTFPDLLLWLEEAVAFPNTMVDRIVPASTQISRTACAKRLGLADAGALTTEPFRQWVIENQFAGPRPRWEAAGVELVDSTAPFEAVKLGLLNATHSALACLGLLAGHETVDAAMADEHIARFIRAFMSRELMPALVLPPGFNLEAYRDDLLKRFANTSLGHRCDQVATDSSEKISQRWLVALQRRPGPLLGVALSAWVYRVLETSTTLHDPRADRLLAARSSQLSQAERVAMVLACARIDAGAVAGFDQLVGTIEGNLDRLRDGGLHALLCACLTG